MSVVAPPSNEPVLAMPGKSLAPGAAFSWIAEGWGLFRASALMWVVLTILLIIVAIAFAFVPIIGSLAWQVLTPVIAGGLVLGCRALENAEDLELEHLVAGFKQNFAGLAIVGVLYVVGGVVVLLVFALFAGLSLLPALLAGDSSNALGAIATMGTGLALGTMVVTLLSLLLGAAIWLAPALVVMHRVAPVEAVTASFLAVVRNIVPAFIYAVVMLVLAILAAIPFGLGMVLWFPILVTSSYRAYRQIFTT